jgi:DNA repair photolyase
MKAIYEPAGRAREYCERACNLYRGCGHGCTYCYVPACIHVSREEFARPKPRPGILEALAKDAPAHAGRDVFLCFSCDPYQPIDREERLTRQAITILGEAGCRPVVLTKGAHAGRDFDLLRRYGGSFGVTLTTLERAHAAELEPGASDPGWRCELIREASDQGIHTWVSLEPVVDHRQALGIVAELAGYLDMVKVGKWNYDRAASLIDWTSFARDITNLCQELEVPYLLKRDLAAYLQT